MEKNIDFFNKKQDPTLHSHHLPHFLPLIPDLRQPGYVSR